MLNLPDCASRLQEQGFTVVLYDPRNTGSSGGQPRDDIDPPQAVGDISDALTYLLTLPSVEPAQVGVFGMSFGGTVALTASALDPRIRFTIAVAPVTDFAFTSAAQRARVLQKCIRDRESQVLGNPAYTVPLVNDQGENAVGLGHGVDKETYGRLIREGREIAPGHVNRITIMSYYKIAMWTPWPLWKSLGSLHAKGGSKRGQGLGVLFVVPQKDQVSYPEMQRHYYDQLGEEGGCKKKQIEVNDAGHEDVLGEKYISGIILGIVGFVKDILEGSI